MINYCKHLSLWLLILISGCFEEQNIYNKSDNLNDIENLISRIIEIDSIEINYPNYKIVAVLPKYINRKNQEGFKPKPPPYGDYLFPDLEEEFSDLKETKFSSDENIYIAKQKEDSKPIELSDQLFGKRKKKINLFQDTYIYFSIPIFNKSRNLAWIKTGIACGKTCGEGRTLILQKINGKWKIINKKSNWII
ncbi:hypothetical protein N9157_00370 [Saprospiraceae bacterium]|nr:hypothetical protein [Saprospiraceae bacterium]MDB4505597.1 hypothetical protein [Saprospiraceae bacterium]MDB4539462.1 hypothetical protein [Saprospiraceae bacterium]MDC3219655.1 hypothetical protein [Saprospiraceae bacterium]